MLLFIFTVLYAFVRIFLYYSKLCKSDYGLEMIVGQIGSGKTSIICDKMVKDLKNGWNVYADFHTNIQGVRFFDTTRLADCLPDEQSTIYVDEGALRWFSRDFKSFSAFTEWFAMVRHAKCKMILCSQSFDVDLFIRNRCKALYLVKRIGCVSVIRRIKKLQTVNVQTQGQTSTDVKTSGLVDGYKYDSIFAKGGLHVYWLPKLWKYHDSFYLPTRNPLPYELEDGIE